MAGMAFQRHCVVMAWDGLVCGPCLYACPHTGTAMWATQRGAQRLEAATKGGELVVLDIDGNRWR